MAQVVEGLADALALVRGSDDAVELEGEVRERLADAIVQVTGDAGALLVGADRAQAVEPPGVVDRERGRLDEPVEQLEVAGGERRLPRLRSTEISPMSEPRARSEA